MKAIIMAAGNHRTFDRKKIIINEETLISRTIRQLLERNVNDIKITASYTGQHSDISNAIEIVNEITGHNLGCLYGIKDIEADIYLYSDVFYSNYAMDRIMEGETTYYGRSDPSPIKKYGEFVIKRGTPLAVYIPYERNKYDYDIQGPTGENAKWANESYLHVRTKFRGGYKLHQAEVKKCPFHKNDK